MYFRPLSQQLPGLTDPNMIGAENRSLFINCVILNFKQTPPNVDGLVRRTLADINPNLTVIDLRPMTAQVANNFTQERLIARLTALFGLLALLLASVGLYGTTSYQVTRRTSEIGLRMALGAQQTNVIWMIVRDALSQAGLGLLIGIPIAILGAHAMTDQLYGVRSYDPMSFALAVFVLFASAAAAAFIPAQRAAATEPMLALRSE